jgi:uncharacterized protein (TIGR02600 family)
LQADVDSYLAAMSMLVGRAAGPNLSSSSRAGSPDVGDFTTGFGTFPVGALVLGPDVGAVSLEANIQTDNRTMGPYFSMTFSRSGATDDQANNVFANSMNFMGILFSPFRQIPSPVLLGTLPARSAGSSSSPGSWETLLFNPVPAGGRANHRGWNTAPRDHFLMDLFYMPVAEPFAITENFATAGKINLNYQIAPFTYIRRMTALHALLDGMTERWVTPLQPNFPGRLDGSSIFALPTTVAANSSFRSGVESPVLVNPFSAESSAADRSFRSFVDVGQTLRSFIRRMEQENDPFVSATEITEIPLVPAGTTLEGVDAFWSNRTLTGDDKREMPYNHLLPRVTTRSNTFRVHYWVQSLRHAAGVAEPIVVGEARGSTLIERFLDPNLASYGSSFGDGTTFNVDAAFPPLHDKYRFRKVEEKRFSP